MQAQKQFGSFGKQLMSEYGSAGGSGVGGGGSGVGGGNGGLRGVLGARRYRVSQSVQSVPNPQ